MRKALGQIFAIIFFLFMAVVIYINYNTPDPIVYRCGESKLYHKIPTHNALVKSCKSDIKEMKESEARAKGLSPCKCKY